jgi:hypothetical protein
VIQSAKGAHCPTLAVSARQNEMMADVPDVDGTTCKGLDQPLRRDLPMADRGDAQTLSNCRKYITAGSQLGCIDFIDAPSVRSNRLSCDNVDG